MYSHVYNYSLLAITPFRVNFSSEIIFFLLKVYLLGFFFFFDEGMLAVKFFRIMFFNLKLFFFCFHSGSTTLYIVLGWQLFSVNSLNTLFHFASSFHCCCWESSCQNKCSFFVGHFFSFSLLLDFFASGVCNFTIVCLTRTSFS